MAGFTNGALTGHDDQKSPVLDRRRRKLQEARTTADTAAGRVRQLEEQIDTNAAQGHTHDADLRAALDRVAGLKKLVKSTAKEAERLREARKTARQRAATAQQRAADAEGRYDEAVLAELVRREKRNDLAAHSGPAGRSAGNEHSETAPSGTGADTRPDIAVDGSTPPQPERSADLAPGTTTAGAPDATTSTADSSTTDSSKAETPAADTARATAARRTAARAGSATTRQPRTVRTRTESAGETGTDDAVADASGDRTTQVQNTVSSQPAPGSSSSE